jgi:spore germination protein GerM
MKRLLINKSAIKQSLLFITVVILSIWAGSNPVSFQQEKLPVSVTTSSTIPNNSVQQIQPQVYWLRSNQNKLTLVAKSLPPNKSGATPQQVLTIAVQNLLSVKPRDDLTSTIPKGTKLLSLQVRSDGVHVDLSPEFRSGGGSTSMIYRVAQVVYTTTSLDPNQKVFISVGGQSIDNNNPLGGEGLILQQPTTRTQFADDFL